MKPTPTEHFDLVPPWQVRLLARARVRRADGVWITKGMTDNGIVSRSGLSLKVVKKISRLRSWGSVRVSTAQSYAQACGHDLLRPSLSLKYLSRWARKGDGFRYLSANQFLKLKKFIT